MDRENFLASYQTALQKYLQSPDEELRQEAYSLGRQALELALGLMELAQLHGTACAQVVAAGAEDSLGPQSLQRAAEFFAETAAPYEMELRGYREALARNEALLLQAQRVEALGRLVGGVVHDFNNLLGIIGGFTDLALEDELTANSASLHQTLLEVRKATRRAADLTRQLLAFTRKQTPEPKALDLNAVMTDTVQMLYRLLGTGIEMKVSLLPTLWPVKADAGQMAQVLMNLAINARDAMPQGGVIQLATANFELQPTSAAENPTELPPGRYVILSVTDTGTGMDAATQARIFEPFFTTKAPGAGTGLGLATVLSIVKQSKGILRVESQPGQGTCFKIYFPASSEAVAEAITNPGLVSSLHGGETLLLVENDASIRHLALSLLRRGGYSVLEACHGAEALEIAAQGTAFPLLITDLDMPGIDGFELSRRLRAQCPELKVLFVSGSITDNRTDSITLGVGTDFLGKPYTALELLTCVRSLLDRKVG